MDIFEESVGKEGQITLALRRWRMEGPRIEFTKRLDMVILKKGEFLAVFFVAQENPREQIQVELRNTDQYGLEIFVDSSSVDVKSFDKWNPID